MSAALTWERARFESSYVTPRVFPPDLPSSPTPPTQEQMTPETGPGPELSLDAAGTAVVHLRMSTSSSCPSDPLGPPSPPLETQPGLRNSFSAHSQEVEGPGPQEQPHHQTAAPYGGQGSWGVEPHELCHRKASGICPLPCLSGLDDCTRLLRFPIHPRRRLCSTQQSRELHAAGLTASGDYLSKGCQQPGGTATPGSQLPCQSSQAAHVQALSVLLNGEEENEEAGEDEEAQDDAVPSPGGSEEVLSKYLLRE
ncbi:hypothetical protein H8959_006874 [Pygathrix nigripes]